MTELDGRQRPGALPERAYPDREEKYDLPGSER